MRRTSWIALVLAVLLTVIFVAVFAGDILAPEPDVPGNVSVVADDLDIPWEIAILPDGELLVTERTGTLQWIEDGEAYRIAGVEHTGEGGLLGMALHPDFAENRQIYLYMTTETGDSLTNRVVRYRLGDDRALSNPETIIDGIPGAQYHDGGRIAFGPDGDLYITTGDAGEKQWAQAPNALSGKILRLEPDGDIPPDNPFGNEVYSYGHRNPQGLAWDAAGNLWATEHGETGRDELNLIQAGQNYGWPLIEGSETAQGLASPVLQSGQDTWAPAGMTYVDGYLVFAGLWGESLYVADIQEGRVRSFDQVFEGVFGRIRAVTRGPEGDLYVSTSNTDGRGRPYAGDDRVYRIDADMIVG